LNDDINFNFCSPNVGESITIKVESTANMNNVFCAVTGRSSVTVNQLMEARNRRSFEFNLNITRDFAPSTSIIVYYIHDSGEVVYDRITVDIAIKLSNNVSDFFLILPSQRFSILFSNS
jgi:hypothetical protein